MRFTIECEMKDRWVPHFLGMLYKMEQLGKLGSSRMVTMYADGDGDFRPKFKVLETNEPLPAPAKPLKAEEFGGCPRSGGYTYDAG